MTSLLLYSISWILIGYLSFRMAQKRGRNPMFWFFLGTILGLIAVLILYLLPSKIVSVPIEINAPPKEAVAHLPHTLWYYLDPENNQHGPMSFDALKKAWTSKKINLSTYVWNEKMDEWKVLQNLPKDLLMNLQN